MGTAASPQDFFERWLREVSAGYALEQMLAGRAGPLSAAEVLYARKLLRSIGLFDQGNWKAHALLSLPPATLQQVARLNHATLAKLSELAKAHIEALQHSPDGTSLLLRAKMVANRLQAGTHTPGQMIHLIWSELDLDLRGRGDLAATLQQFMDISSDAHVPPRRVVEALGFVSSAVGPQWRWRLIENSILHGLFIWPMAVFDGHDADAPGHAGSTLPLHVNVYIPPLATPRGNPSVRFTSKERLIDLKGGLAKSAQRALQAAISIWQNEFSNWSPEFQKCVAQAQATIDLGYAHEVRARAGYSGPLPLGGRSIELYLSLSFLGHFLGDASLRTVAATGVLGKANRYRSWDTLIDEIDGWSAKLARACLSPEFDRLLFPFPGDSEKLIKEEVPPNVSVRRVTRLEESARIVFTDTFTKHRFIRCPDLEAAFRSLDPLYEADLADVAEVKTLIETSEGSVLELPRRFSGGAVARALFTMNAEAGATARRVGAYLSEGDRPSADEFLQSFAFIRVVDYEQSERFWQVVWELLTGNVRLDTPNPLRQAGRQDGLRRRRSTGWREFAFTLQPNRPGEMLASLFNRTNSNYRTQSRVPDKLVIVGSDKLKTLEALCPTGPFARLRLDAVLPALRDSLAPRSRRLAEALGRARIILVPDDKTIGRKAIGAEDLPRDLREHVLSLSVFKFGFTLDVAKSVLDLDDWDCRSVLSALMHHEIDGVPLISAASREQADFIMNVEVDTSREPPARIAKRHHRAALALVGFSANGSATRSADYRRAFKPANVHDAERHLSEARWTAGKGTSSGIVDDIRRMQDRLSRLAEPFSWSAVRFIASQPGDYGLDEALTEAAMDHLAYWHAGTHPIEMMHLVRLLWNRYRWAKKSSDRRREDILAQVSKSLNLVVDRALRDVAGLDRTFDGVRERDACQFIIGSTLACLMLDERPISARIKYEGKHDIDNPLKVITLNTAFRMADQNAVSAREALDLGWFAYRGDYEGLHSEAAAHYLAGFANPAIAEMQARAGDLVPLVKYLGCCRLTGLSPVMAAAERVRSLNRQQLVFLCTNPVSPRGLQDEVARRRWQAGRLEVLDILAGYFEQAGDHARREHKLRHYRQGALFFCRFQGLEYGRARREHYHCLLKYLGLTVRSGTAPDVAIVRLAETLPADARDRVREMYWPKDKALMIAGKMELLRIWKSTNSAAA